ncbi:MAG: class I SAM-dependent methyltransferase [Acidobacteriota bacterium]
MAHNPAPPTWSGDRGARWRSGLAGVEGTFAPVDPPLIDALRLEGALRIAEIGCGGGGTTLEIARRADAGSLVHGFDISPDLLAAARERTAAERGEPAAAVRFSRSNVESDPPPEEPYDRLVSRFGILFYEDPPRAFGRMTRWLNPGGRLAFAVWGPPADNPWASALRETAAQHLELAPPDPEAPGPFRYADDSLLLGLLDRAGFRDLEQRDWRGTIPVGGGLPAEGAADFVLGSFSIGEAVGRADEATRRAVRRGLARRFSEDLVDGVVRMAARVRLVTGRGPG